MSFLPSFFFVLFCLSMHACLARHFEFVKIDSVQGTTDSAGMTPDQTKITNSEDVSIGPSSGDEIFKSSSFVEPLKSTSTEGSTRRRGLSVVRFDECSNFKKVNKNKVHEDADEVIDYDPPHRTPPIHNRKV